MITSSLLHIIYKELTHFSSHAVITEVALLFHIARETCWHSQPLSQDLYEVDATQLTLTLISYILKN